MGRRKTKNPPLSWKTKRQQQKIEAESRLHEKVQSVRKTSEEEPSRPPSIAQMQANMMSYLDDDEDDEGLDSTQLVLEGRFEEAIRYAEDGASNDDLIAKAEALRHLGQLEEALAVSEEQMGSVFRIEYQHAEILYEMGKIRELEKLCDDWEEEEGADDPFVVSNRAKILFKRGNVEEAVSMLKDVIRDGEIGEYAYVPLIEIMIHEGNTDEALRLCEEAYQGVYTISMNHIRRIQTEILLDAGDVEGARSVCSGMLEKWPHHATFLALQEKINTK